MNNQTSILIEITKSNGINEDWSQSNEYDVFLHKVPNNMKRTQWESVGSVPFKHVGFLTAEEIGQYMGGN